MQLTSSQYLKTCFNNVEWIWKHFMRTQWPPTAHPPFENGHENFVENHDFPILQCLCMYSACGVARTLTKLSKMNLSDKIDAFSYIGHLHSFKIHWYRHANSGPTNMEIVSRIQSILHKKVENEGKYALKPENIKKYLELGQKIVCRSYDDVQTPITYVFIPYDWLYTPVEEF